MTRPRVAVVRAERRAGPLVERLEAAGFDAVRCPLVDLESLGEGFVHVGGYDWLVVTSPNAAEELGRRGLAGRPARVAAVGPGTAAALAASAGLVADLVPGVSSQEGLLAELPRPAGRVLLAAAEGARPLLAEELGADVLALYRTVELAPRAFPEADLVALASSSQASAFARLELALPAVSIGPQTTATATAAGVRVLAEADPHDLDGLVAAVGRAAASL